MGGSGAVREADCPVVTPDFDPRNFMPRASNDPATGQRAPLGQERVASSIPIGARLHTAALQPARTPAQLHLLTALL